jgi:hypothetical protein
MPIGVLRSAADRNIDDNVSGGISAASTHDRARAVDRSAIGQAFAP